jgi:type I restriction enzyme S subunit
MLPEGWTLSSVGAACAIKNHLRLPLSAEHRSNIQGPYPYLGPTGVLGHIDHYRIDEPFALIGEDGDHFLKFKQRPMTLRFSGKANVNNHAHVIGDSKKCLSGWFYYWFMHRDITAVLSRQGVGRYKLTKAGLEELDILLPPIEEQEVIVQFLDVWDQAVAAAENLLAKSLEEKRALIAHMLRKSSHWKSARLDSISERVQRKSDGGSYPVLMISAALGFVPQSQMYSRFMAGESLEHYTLLRQGEFAYNKGNSKAYEFGCIYPLEELEQGLVPHVYICFSMDESTCFRPFYKHLFDSDYLHDQLGPLVNTGVRNNGLLNIRPADFFRVQIPVPPVDEQRSIAGIMDTANQSLCAMERNIEKLKTEKAALMQQLLTGKRRVRVPVRAMETEPA